MSGNPKCDTEAFVTVALCFAAIVMALALLGVGIFRPSTATPSDAGNTPEATAAQMPCPHGITNPTICHTLQGDTQP